MRNINELIGIIKGINFDGVVNEKEVKELKLWLNNNRNLAYNEKEIELISLVDQVLEDNIITNVERKQMLNLCKKYNCTQNSEYYMMHELNGIVKGIICDDEINSSEVYRLKNWFDQNGKYVRRCSNTALIIKIVEDILSDGIVTKEEQDSLLLTLKNRMKQSRFEIKLNSLLVRAKKRENIGLDLIDFLDNENAINEIHDLASTQLINELNPCKGYYDFRDGLVFISVVVIAMLHYDGNLYDHIQDAYPKVYDKYSDQKIQCKIREVLKKYGNGKIHTKKNDRFIEIALVNTIVPGYYLAHFFEFIYDIYQINFNFELSDNLKEDFQFVYEGIKDDLNETDDETKLMGTKKTYKLIKSTKKLIKNNLFLDSMIDFSIIIVKLIDKRIWGKKLKVVNPYLKEGFDTWEKTLIKDTNRIKQKHNNELKSQWKPYYTLGHDGIYINTPTHRIKAKYDYYKIEFIITDENNKIIYKQKPDNLIKIIGGYEIASQKFILTNPLAKIRYKLVCDFETIYDSKDLLYRDYIVFDAEKNNEIANKTNYQGQIIVCLKNRTKQFEQTSQIKYYDLFEDSVNLGDVKKYADDLFYFSKKNEPGLLGEEKFNHFIVNSQTSEKIKVYTKIDYILFEDYTPNANYMLLLDGVYKKLSRADYEVNEIDNKYTYLVNIEGMNDGLHKVKILKIEGNKQQTVIQRKFVLDNHLFFNTQQINDDEFIFRVQSTFFAEQQKTIKLEDFSLDWCEFTIDNQEFYYKLPYKLNIYKLDNQVWKTSDEKLWCNDIKHNSVLEIYNQQFDKLIIYGQGNQELITIDSFIADDEITKINLGFIKSYKAYNDYCILSFVKNNKYIFNLKCLNRIIIDEQQTNFVFDKINNKLIFSLYYYGKGNVGCKIIVDDNQVLAYQENIQNRAKVTFDLSEEYEHYKINFYEKSTGLSLNSKQTIKEYDRYFYSRSSLVKKIFPIKKAEYEYYDKVNLEPHMQEFKIRKTYLKFLKKINNDKFEGEIYRLENNEYVLLDEISPVIIEICNETEDGQMEVAINTKDGDGLLLDRFNYTIFNELENKSASDIFIHLIDTQGGTR